MLLHARKAVKVLTLLWTKATITEAVNGASPVILWPPTSVQHCMFAIKICYEWLLCTTRHTSIAAVSENYKLGAANYCYHL